MVPVACRGAAVCGHIVLFDAPHRRDQLLRHHPFLRPGDTFVASRSIESMNWLPNTDRSAVLNFIAM
jgi:hypothetical protein